MPVTHLPKILEININNILELAKVSSWNIHGEKENLQITIRFCIMDSTTDTDTMATAKITYRKVLPSQVRRDRERAKSRLSYIIRILNVHQGSIFIKMNI